MFRNSTVFSEQDNKNVPLTITLLKITELPSFATERKNFFLTGKLQRIKAADRKHRPDGQALVVCNKSLLNPRNYHPRTTSSILVILQK